MGNPWSFPMGFEHCPYVSVCVGHAGSGHRAELHLGIVSGSVEVVREAQGGSMVGNLVPLIYPHCHRFASSLIPRKKSMELNLVPLVGGIRDL